MAKKYQRRRQKKPEIVKGCSFCKTSTVPYWRDIEVLQKHLSPRSRISPRTKTGVCAKHQKLLAESIKHARHLGLLPFITQVTR